MQFAEGKQANTISDVHVSNEKSKLILFSSYIFIFENISCYSITANYKRKEGVGSYVCIAFLMCILIAHLCHKLYFRMIVVAIFMKVMADSDSKALEPCQSQHCSHSGKIY